MIPKSVSVPAGLSENTEIVDHNHYLAEDIEAGGIFEAVLVDSDLVSVDLESVSSSASDPISRISVSTDGMDETTNDSSRVDTKKVRTLPSLAQNALDAISHLMLKAPSPRIGPYDFNSLSTNGFIHLTDLLNETVTYVDFSKPDQLEKKIPMVLSILAMGHAAVIAGQSPGLYSDTAGDETTLSGGGAGALSPQDRGWLQLGRSSMINLIKVVGIASRVSSYNTNPLKQLSIDLVHAVGSQCDRSHKKLATTLLIWIAIAGSLINFQHRGGLADIYKDAVGAGDKLPSIDPINNPFQTFSGLVDGVPDYRIASHNAGSSTKYAGFFSPISLLSRMLANHESSITQQLDLGVRVLMLDVASHEDGLMSVHGPLKYGSAVPQLREIAQFVTKEENQDEMILIMLENTNRAHYGEISKAFKEAGLYDYLPKHKDAWLPEYNHTSNETLPRVFPVIFRSYDFTNADKEDIAAFALATPVQVQEEERFHDVVCAYGEPKDRNCTDGSKTSASIGSILDAFNATNSKVNSTSSNSTDLDDLSGMNNKDDEIQSLIDDLNNAQADLIGLYNRTNMTGVDEEVEEQESLIHSILKDIDETLNSDVNSTDYPKSSFPGGCLDFSDDCADLNLTEFNITDVNITDTNMTGVDNGTTPTVDSYDSYPAVVVIMSTNWNQVSPDPKECPYSCREITKASCVELINQFGKFPFYSMTRHFLPAVEEHVNYCSDDASSDYRRNLVVAVDHVAKINH